MQTLTKNNGRKTYLQVIDKDAEKALDELIDYLRAHNLYFYQLTERNEGTSKYIDIQISIKLS